MIIAIRYYGKTTTPSQMRNHSQPSDLLLLLCEEIKPSRLGTPQLPAAASYRHPALIVIHPKIQDDAAPLHPIYLDPCVGG